MDDHQMRMVQKHIKKIARQAGRTEAEIRKEMEYAIHFARGNPDPKTQAVYRSLFGEGTPTVHSSIIAALDISHQSIRMS